MDSGWLGYPGYSEAGTGRYKGTRTKEEQARQVDQDILIQEFYDSVGLAGYFFHRV